MSPEEVQEGRGASQFHIHTESYAKSRALEAIFSGLVILQELVSVSMCGAEEVRFL